MDRLHWGTLALVACASLACKSGRFVQEEEKAPPAQPAVSTSSNVPPPPAPKGPVGTVAGVIRVSGDAAPELKEVLDQIPPGKCPRAGAMYGKLFREGPGRSLGDVLVAVTEYEGSVPSLNAPVTIETSGCAFSSRTAALAVWQQLEVKNTGAEAVTPQLLGSSAPAVLVALPGGRPVPLPFKTPGEYVVIDHTHPFAQVDVFVLNFPTFTVTGVDGAFQVAGVPTGPALLSAFLPVTGQKVEQRITVVENQALNVELTIPFDLKKHGPRPKPTAEGPASAGAPSKPQ